MPDRIILKISLLCVVLFPGCGQNTNVMERKPSDVYQNYYIDLAQGMSFDQDAAYHSNAKQAEVREKIDAMKRNSTKTTEQIISLYLNLTQAAAKCGELTLREERIEGETAYLVYDRTDTCGNGETKQSGETITMVYENGWKIHDSLSSY